MGMATPVSLKWGGVLRPKIGQISLTGRPSLASPHLSPSAPERLDLANACVGGAQKVSSHVNF